jgi:hypothetical protein
MQHITTVECGRRFKRDHRPVRREGRRDGGGLRPAAGRAGPGDDGHLVYHNGHIFDKDGIGQIGRGGQHLHPNSQFPQRIAVCSVLFAGPCQINWYAFQVC